MKKQFVTYEIAKEFKDFRFNESCFGYYNIKKELCCPCINHLDWIEQIRNEGNINAPLWQQVIDWFREKNIKIVENSEFGWNVYVLYDDKYIIDSELNDREQAILKAIEIVVGI